MKTPLLRWLSFRVRIICVSAFLVGTLLPPYVPRSAQALDDTPAGAAQFLFVEEGFLMKTSSLGEQGSRLAFGEGLVHTVQPGDTAESVAKRYQLKNVETILWANNLQKGAKLTPNQEVVVLPVDGVLHTVRRGQTLSRIAQLYEVPQEEIARQNHIRGSFIVSGQQLIVPGGKPLIGDSAAAIASNGDGLQFADRLENRDINVQLQIPSKPVPGAKSGGAPAAPDAGPSAAATLAVLQMPCASCHYTQYFSAKHYAVDIQTKGGGPVYAAEAGTVLRADKGWNGGYGSVIEIDHGNGLVTLYAHNKELYVKEGDSVSRGQNVSWMGNTGLVHGPTGIHVHFEVRVNGIKKNPLLYLE